MMWSNEEPTRGINAANFSIVWKGFIKAPISDQYKFKCVNDDGCMVLINDSPIIQDRMDDKRTTDFLKYKRKDMTKAINEGNYVEWINPAYEKKKAKEDDPNAKKPFESDEISLPGSELVPIEIR